jgi:bifunctional UDP-N-acetylglucosamine pyrophosphorylase/glucosamine-1-phosphate N-acetyltransferase
MTLAIILLAAGKGTRMNSKYQKILHEVGGKPMVRHLFEAAEKVADVPPVLVIAPDDDGVQRLIGPRAHYAVQAEQLGTGHATQMAQPLLHGRTQQVLVTYGDMPLLKAETMQQLAATQTSNGAAIVMLTVMGEPDSSFGRVVRAADGRVLEIVEVAEAKQRPNSADLLAIREHNAGVYCFDATFLWDNIGLLPLRQARSGPEYYLTDMVETAVRQNRLVHALVTQDADECLGAGTRAEMVAVEQAFRRRANAYWLAHGVTLIDPATTFIDPDVTIGQDTVIWPGSYIQGRSVIGADCVIGPNTIVRHARLGDGCQVVQSVVAYVNLGAGSVTRPYTVLGWPTGEEE